MTPPITLMSSDLQATVLQRGATLAALRFGQEARNLVLGFTNPVKHADIPIYAGAIVGPVANRITRGEVTLDGKTYRMPLNENGETCLHSGPRGLHNLDWRVVDQTNSAVTLAIHLQDGDHGLPGNRDISVTYRLDGNTLILDITAQSDKPTAMNIAAHPYWNLDGKTDLAGHQLQIAADHYLPVDPRNLPTGQIAETAQSAFDFRQFVEVPTTAALDINFCLNTVSATMSTPSARLLAPSGIQLEITTTAPGLQVYNGAFLPHMAGVLDDGRDLVPYGGIALEPQGWPDAPHHPTFPQITLNPGEVFRQVTRYRLTAPH